jgi:hypothetical protein
LEGGQEAVSARRGLGEAGLASGTGRAIRSPGSVWEAFFGNAPEAIRDATAALKLAPARELQYGGTFALALAGDSSRTQELVDALEHSFPEDTSVNFSYLPALRGLLALNHHDVSKSLEQLQKAVPYELSTPRSGLNAYYGAFCPVFVRGEAYLAAHKGSEAATEFQKLLDHRALIASDPVAALAQLQLGRAYALAGNNAKAKASYQDFLRLWKEADPDIPVLKQAKAEYAKLP